MQVLPIISSTATKFVVPLGHLELKILALPTSMFGFGSQPGTSAGTKLLLFQMQGADEDVHLFF